MMTHTQPDHSTLATLPVAASAQRAGLLSTGLLAAGLLATGLLVGCAGTASSSAGERARTITAWQGEAQPSGVEVIARVQQTPGNIAVSPEGRIFISLHPFGAPTQRVLEVLPTGETRPYPNEAWSKAVGEDGKGIEGIIGLRCTQAGVLWMLDLGSAKSPARLVAWDTRSETLVKTISLADSVTSRSFVQDLAIDTQRNMVYIADCGLGDLSTPPEPAIIVVDVASGTSVRVLQAEERLLPERFAEMVIDGTEVRAVGKDGKPFAPRVGLNPITIDHTNTFVYFGAMHGTCLYRIRAELLASARALPKAERDARLAEGIEFVGNKRVSDGITIDTAGNLYVTDVSNNAISIVENHSDGDRHLYYLHRPFLRDIEYLAWADGLSMGPDGKGYATVNQLHRHAALNAGTVGNTPPYFIVRFTPRAPGVVGR
jgi:sugar lactone lactonase YvrE